MRIKQGSGTVRSRGSSPVKPALLACALATLLLLTGCGPTAEQIATMTASAWTPTPPPTATATPIPYDLTVHVTDDAGSPLAGTKLVLPESGSNEAVLADTSGQYTWKDLASGKATLQVSAPGYLEGTQAVTLQRGPNEITVSLRRDPLGLMPADACRADEKLLYMEDFQNGQAPDWKVTAGNASGWSIVTRDEGNRAASIGGIGSTQVELSGYSFDNIVWRLRVQAGGRDGDSFLNLKHFPAGHDTRYIIQWGASPLLAIDRWDAVTGDRVLARGSFQAKPDTWWYVEASVYHGTIQVWVDGRKQIQAKDPNPLPPGTIGVEAHISRDPQTAYYFDNISVCQLSAPFTASLYKPPP